MSNSLVDGAWLENHLDDPDICVLEVVRDLDASYGVGRIPGACRFDWKSFLWDPVMREFPGEEEFALRLAAAGISNGTTIVVCGTPVQYGTYGWWVLKYCGHGDVRLLNGGKEKWLREGRPVTNDRLIRAPAVYAPQRRAVSMRASRQEVMAALGDGATLLLDHRSPAEYAGERVAPLGMDDHGAERHGRIPGAKNLPFDMLLNDDDTFKSRKELLDNLKSLGASPSARIISYCRLSHRATLACFAMTELLGFANVRTYDGSWTEWGSLVGVPVER